MLTQTRTILSIAALLALSALASFVYAEELIGSDDRSAETALLADEQLISITAVEYVGNKVTRERLLNQQLYFSAPETVSGKTLADSVQAIRDLGLFESVRPELLQVAGGHVLRITLDEKFYIIPLPRIGLNSDGETSYGGSLEWDNIAGLNQRAKFVWERRQLSDAELGEREVLRLNYDYPRVAGSLWNAGFFTRHSRVPVEESAADGGRRYVEEDERHGINLGRQLSQYGQTKGWFINGSLFYLLKDNTPHSAVPELAGGSTWAASLGATFQDRRLLTYSEEGVQYGLRVESSLPVGSPDFSYTLVTADWRLVTAGFKTGGHHSMIYRAGAGAFSGGIPEQTGFSNSSGNLRGLKKGEIEGNAVLYGSIEYLLPVHRKLPSLRYGAFLDMAVFADSYRELCACNSTYSLGFALVWRPKKLVKVELRGEYGYNVDSKTSRAGGGLTRF